MLDAILETIGTLAVLASIAAKFMDFPATGTAGDDAGRRVPDDTESGMSAMSGERPGAAHAPWRERR